MAHMLVTMYGLEKDVVESMLHEHTRKRTFDGIDLEHIWKNSEDEEEVIFLFRTDHPERARALLTRIHEDIQIRHPEILAPEIILLKK